MQQSFEKNSVSLFFDKRKQEALTLSIEKQKANFFGHVANEVMANSYNKHGHQHQQLNHRQVS